MLYLSSKAFILWKWTPLRRHINLLQPSYGRDNHRNAFNCPSTLSDLYDCTDFFNVVPVTELAKTHENVREETMVKESENNTVQICSRTIQQQHVLAKEHEHLPWLNDGVACTIQ